MTTIDRSLFKKYDIRGRAAGANAALTEGFARLLGRAFGTYLQRVEGQTRAVIGRDNRHTSPALAAAVIDGLRATGCDVLDIGLVSTPLVYWQAVRDGSIGGLMITGSHLAPEFNGAKLSVGARNLYGDAIQALRQLIEADDFADGEGAVRDDPDIIATYVADLVTRLPMARALHIVVDAGNGTGGLIGPRLFETLGHRVTRLFCEPDGSYPNHQPDPQEAKNMAALAAKVIEVGADLGIAFDGDADRMGAVDERGAMIVADRVLALLARDMLRRHPGAAVVADVLSTQVLFDEVERAGGVPVMWASGHSLVKARMVETGALLGGEASGHIFMGEDYFGFDDAYLAAGRLLQLVAASDGPLSALDATVPTLFSTPEYRPHCPDDAKELVIQGVRAALEDQGEVVAVDGVRIRFERGWGLIRASNTEPVLSLRFEGETEADALAYRDLFVRALSAYPQVEPIV